MFLPVLLGASTTRIAQQKISGSLSQTCQEKENETSILILPAYRSAHAMLEVTQALWPPQESAKLVLPSQCTCLFNFDSPIL